MIVYKIFFFFFNYVSTVIDYGLEVMLVVVIHIIQSCFYGKDLK